MVQSGIGSADDDDEPGGTYRMAQWMFVVEELPPELASLVSMLSVSSNPHLPDVGFRLGKDGMFFLMASDVDADSVYKYLKENDVDEL